ncbi:MAG: glutathione S-transferase N-terminal domain-containing protein [Paracoccus sp. (in: a-proteobacteria)]|uniref:glutathione S-transferase N-terminal domain-containing protein n=1 Tax=Paracoccus sp. TaxID=267 RepID=UPI0026DF74B1|nr:glutathione S-transferase N-terminal domain-containing protein [Paracoccus sp. (in: a-proteobacteria)]MDO5631814.1 glutathione S-transferase N-terminal domain-containing protein [Paracoccus sp. (in: a-proteobacteria)]
MTTLESFPITRRWPPRRPDVIQLYSLPTPNGVKASIMLEELGAPYDVHRISIGDPADQMTPEFLSLNPNNKIPAILDPDGPDGMPMGLWESGAILIYLADKYQRFLPTTGAARYQVLQWLMFQMGGVGPMFGQLGFFHRYKGREIQDPRPRERYYAESRRILGVIDGQLAERDWIAGDYSIADIAIGPWVRNLRTGYDAAEQVGLDDFAHVARWQERFLARPAVQRGLVIPAAPT